MVDGNALAAATCLLGVPPGPGDGLGRHPSPTPRNGCVAATAPGVDFPSLRYDSPPAPNGGAGAGGAVAWFPKSEAWKALGSDDDVERRLVADEGVVLGEAHPGVLARHVEARVVDQGMHGVRQDATGGGGAG